MSLVSFDTPCRNAPCGQVLVLPSRRLVRPAADDDFVIDVIKNKKVQRVTFLETCFLIEKGMLYNTFPNFVRRIAK